MVMVNVTLDKQEHIALQITASIAGVTAIPNWPERDPFWMPYSAKRPNAIETFFDQHTFSLDMDLEQAQNVALQIHRDCGKLGFAPIDGGEAPLRSGARKLMFAMSSAFPDSKIQDLLFEERPSDEFFQGHDRPIPDADAKPEDVWVAIVSEIDGDITCYYVLDAQTLDAMNRAKTDPFDYLCRPEVAETLTSFDSLVKVFAHIQTNALNLQGEVGLAGY